MSDRLDDDGRRELAIWRDNLIDADIVVDNCRADLDRALEALRAAVRARDRIAVHLAHLIEWITTPGGDDL